MSNWSIHLISNKNIHNVKINEFYLNKEKNGKLQVEVQFDVLPSIVDQVNKQNQIKPFRETNEENLGHVTKENFIIE